MKNIVIGILLVFIVSGSRCTKLDDQETFNERPVSGIADMTACDDKIKTDGSSRGYILFSPLLSTTTYLIDKKGNVVHTWKSEFPPGVSAYLLENGNLLRCARQPDFSVFHGAGQGGRIQQFTWEGELIWDFILASRDRIQHHDIEPLPNGNILAIVWERKSRQQAIDAGRRSNLLAEDDVRPDCVLEIQPQLPDGGKIVWEWHAWDHLIQDHDPERKNYGRISDHPELIDINGGRVPSQITDKTIERLKSLGYIDAEATPKNLTADLFHTNSIAYNHQLDQILLSISTFNEIWVIDHGTTTREAAGHSGGLAGKGGDLLYRWGNPRNYDRGAARDQRLFGQHDARWIPKSFPGAGNILIFNNGVGRPQGRYSSIIEIKPPLRADRQYSIMKKRRFGPDKFEWEYISPNKRDFYADFISGAHRMANGNTLICSGPKGHFFEVNLKGEIVWTYDNPFTGSAPNPAGDPPYSVFRATHIPKNHPALKGRELNPISSKK